MSDLAKEIVQTIREALASNARTARLCVLIAVGAAAAAFWTSFHS